jgi:hypothetical protein
MKASVLSSYVGGGYFNPAATVTNECRQIRVSSDMQSSLTRMNLNNWSVPTYYITELYRALTSRVLDDEFLFAVYLRGKILLAPYIFNEERCADFEIQVHDDALTVLGYYAVPCELADEGLKRDFG